MSNLFQMIRVFAVSVLFVTVGFAEANDLILANFQPEKTNYYLGEPITVRLTVMSQYTNNCLIISDDMHVVFKQCSEMGEISKIFDADCLSYMNISAAILIWPNKHIQKTFYINQSLKLEKTGTYCIDCIAKIQGSNPGVEFLIPAETNAEPQMDFLFAKRKKIKKGAPGSSITSTKVGSDSIMVKVHKQISFTIAKGSDEQLCKVYGELLGKIKNIDKEHEKEAIDAAFALSSVRNSIVVPYLIGAMVVPDSEVSASVIKALEEIGTPEAVNGLVGIDVMKNNMILKVDGALALGRMKATEGIPFLIKLLDDNYDQAQIGAIQALGMIGTTECLDAIRKKTGGFKGKVKNTAIEVLNKAHPVK